MTELVKLCFLHSRLYSSLCDSNGQTRLRYATWLEELSDNRASTVLSTYGNEEIVDVCETNPVKDVFREKTSGVAFEFLQQ